MSTITEHQSGTASQPTTRPPGKPAASPGPDPGKVIAMALKVWGYK